VYILLGPNLLFSGAVNGYGPGPTFPGIVSVNAGDTVDFAVGLGSRPSYYGDSTGISATISSSPPSSVPEPSSMILLGSGALFLIGYRMRRGIAAARRRPVPGARPATEVEPGCHGGETSIVHRVGAPHFREIT